MSAETLVGYISELYANAHYPPLREITLASDGQLSYTSVYNVVFVDAGACRWRTVNTVVTLLLGDSEKAMELWRTARVDRLHTRRDSAASAVNPPTREEIAALTAAAEALRQEISALRAELKADREKHM